MNKKQLPLISLVLVTYNQQDYIETALDSIFAQDYGNIQIIISDDCSQDRTWEIINEYQYDETIYSSVTKVRQSSNLGLARHLNKVLNECVGEFIVLAAGDDASMPNRVSKLVDHWCKLGKPKCSIFTNAIVINSDGAERGNFYRGGDSCTQLSDFIETGHCWLGGFSHGFSKALFFDYGPISEETFQEDGALAFRAILNSGIHYFDDVTVYYRRHDKNSYDPQDYMKLKRLYRSELGMLKGRLIDLDSHTEISMCQRKIVKGILGRQIFWKRLIVTTPGVVGLIFLMRVGKTSLLRSFRQILNLTPS